MSWVLNRRHVRATLGDHKLPRSPPGPDRSRLRACRGVGLVAFLLLVASSAAAETGKEAFDSDCASCHPISGASTRDGPSLKGVLWRKVASLPDFAYSRALKSSIGTWSPQRLDAFLKNTQAFAPGGGMFFTIESAERRRAIVGYLETLN